MIKLKVKSLWQGQAAIRDKYLEEARREKKGIAITCQGKTMEIPFEELEKAIKGRSEKPFQDRFSRSWHYLIYFDWHPKQETQNTLFK